jgi:two-component system KDP operon response regulator KdpE
MEHARMTPAVLVVEDELPMRRVLRTALGAQGYRVWEAGSREEALNTLKERKPNAILLDLGLPDGSGLEVLRSVRETSELPIVVVSCRGEERDQVLALDSGANDYVAKPFHEGELLARLRVALRTAAAMGVPLEERLQIGSLKIHTQERVAFLNGVEVALTPTEFALLSVLARQAGQVVTHRQLLREVWGKNAQDVQYLRVYMRQLRRKLEQDPNRPQLLMTMPGIGYRMRAPER